MYHTHACTHRETQSDTHTCVYIYIYIYIIARTDLGEELDHFLARGVAPEVAGDGEVGEEDGDGRDALVQVVVKPRHLRKHFLVDFDVGDCG